MKNQYTGDIGDFGKLGLLRQLGNAGFRIGVNWYLTPDNIDRNNDGRFTSYLKNEAFRSCDPQLWEALGTLVDASRRKVEYLQQDEILPAVFFGECMDFAGRTYPERARERRTWQNRAVETLSGSDIIFVDPDNGLIVPSAERSRKSVKYVLPEELEDYYAAGASVIYYQHKARCTDDIYMAHHEELLASGKFPDATGFGLKFRPTSQRYYFFLVHPQHKARIQTVVDAMLKTEWSKYFSWMELSTK